MCWYFNTPHWGCGHSILSKKQSCHRRQPCRVLDIITDKGGESFCRACFISFRAKHAAQVISSPKKRKSATTPGPAGCVIGLTTSNGSSPNQEKRGGLFTWTWNSAKDAVAVARSSYGPLPLRKPVKNTAYHCRHTDRRSWEQHREIHNLAMQQGAT